MNCRKIFLLAMCLVPAALSAGRLETRTATDPNGYRYRYVVGDPYNGREYTLKNGLKVFLSRIPVQPRISFKLAVRAGQADSPPDATGLAHYLEHMLFKGNDRIGALDYAKEKVLLDKIEQLFEQRRKTADPKEKEKIYAEIDRLSGQAAKLAAAGEYSQLIASIGGSGLNAFTASDMTVYVVDIPAQELPKLLRLEAERLRNPVMRLFHTELEAVYEEFNRGMDNDGRLLYEAVNARLFAPHPYSWVPFIGKPEHLKNPSITEITAFLKKYYVPSNMAVLIAGDLDFDRTIQLADRYFSALPAAPAPKRQLAKAGPLKTDQRVTIRSPKSESLRIGFRIEPGRRNELLGTLLADLLSNGSTGLMDTDLILPQKVLSAGAGLNDLRDYSIFQLSGRPKAGQSLDQLAGLLLDELRKVREGRFSEELLKALILNYRKSLAASRENPENALWTYLDAFVKERDYAENLRAVDDLEKIGKKEIVEFAKTLRHYVRADKVTGKADTTGKVPKPKITPVEVNSGKNSAYGKAFLQLPPAPLSRPEAIDFKKDFSILPMGRGDKLFYSNKPSPVNDTLFTLQIYAETGSDHDPLLPLVMGYLDFLGTQKYSAQELRWEFYKDALDFSFSCGDERSSLNLSGFASKMERALELADHFLLHMKPDEAAWKAYVERILKARADAKKNQQANFRALNSFVAYGPDPKNNPLLFGSSLGEKELRAITAQQAVDLVQQVFSKTRLYAYVGPEKAEPLKKRLQCLTSPHHVMIDCRNPPPVKVRKFQLPTEQPRVFLLDYDSAQFLVGIRSRADKIFPDPVNMAKISLFNQYFGAGSLDNVVFQEIRESRSLAYSAYAVYQNVMDKDRYDIVFGFVGTQPDKFFEAADHMLKLFRNMPLYPGKIEQARSKLLKNLSASRTYGNLVGIWFQSEKTGIRRDLKPEIFDTMRKLTPKQIADFAARELAGRKYDLFVVGPVNRLDRKKLEKYGTVRTVTPEQVFGY